MVYNYLFLNRNKVARDIARGPNVLVFGRAPSDMTSSILDDTNNIRGCLVGGMEVGNEN